MASLGLVLVRFLLVWDNLWLVGFEFEVWGPFRFPGFAVNGFPHFRRALCGPGLGFLGLVLVRFTK